LIEEPGDLGPEMQAVLIRLLDLAEAREVRLIATSRQRIEDIPHLARHFLARHPRGCELAFSEGAEELMRRYSWPGNVRQLENAVKRLALTATGPEIRRNDVEAALSGQPEAAQVRHAVSDTSSSIRRLLPQRRTQAWEKLRRLRRQRRVQNAATLGLVLLGPVMALLTYMVLGPLDQGAASPMLRIVLPGFSR